LQNATPNLSTRKQKPRFTREKRIKNLSPFGTGTALYRDIRKRKKMMNKTMKNASKRIKNLEIREKAYAMPIVVKDMKMNDEMVRKFFESMKG
jgi:hypothetical protein